MENALETGIYLLTPTHIGTGQAAGAVDLPIARERHTGYPYLPATALKGVARDLIGRDDSDPQRVKLFGPRPPQKGEPEPAALVAGELVFTDGQLLAFPVRSLNAAFYWVTCPLIVDRWRRLRLARGIKSPEGRLPLDRPCAAMPVPSNVVIEDHLLSQAPLQADPTLTQVAQLWSRLLPPGDGVATRLTGALICVPDADFQHLVTTCTPINARVQLTDGKTTDIWEDPVSGRMQKGNLWYEETLPSDCLFSVMLTTRAGKGAALPEITRALAGHPVVQLGGNETVGQGLVRWGGIRG